MDRLEKIRVFRCVAELESFTRAAEALSLPKATVSTAVQDLEEALKARLFNRTTRRVQLTAEGELLFERSEDLLSNYDELMTHFQSEDAVLSGRLRVDAPIRFSSNILVPALPRFLAAHPQIHLELSSTDRRVDLVKEGFDCVIRVGELSDSGLIARPLGRYDIVNCVSADYLRKRGRPRSLADLADHRLIGYASVLGTKPDGFEYFDGESYRMLKTPSQLTVNNSEAYMAACLAGLGIIQVPRIGVRTYLAEERLVEILPDFQAEDMPVNLLYTQKRHIPRRLKIFMDWVTDLMSEA